jgi:hypothetical protein
MAWTIRQMDDFAGWPVWGMAQPWWYSFPQSGVPSGAIRIRMRAVSMFTSRRMSAPPRSVRRPWQIGHTAGEISAAPQVVAVAAQLQGWIGMGYSGSMSDHFGTFLQLTGGECGEGRATVSLGRAPTAPAALVHRREPCRSRALPGDPRLLRFSRRKESNEVGDE